MRWACAVSEERSLDAAVAQAAAAIEKQLDGRADLVVAFVSPHHQNRYAELPSLVAERLRPRHWIGCSAGGVIGGGSEVEQRPGVSLVAARLPEVGVSVFHLSQSDAEVARGDLATWQPLLGAVDAAGFILLGDPFSFDAENCIRDLDRVYPQAMKVGGLASGGRQPGENALFADGVLHEQGAVGIGLRGDIEIDAVVAQGCRPIGTPMFITRCDRQLLQGLDGRSPYEVLSELFESLGERDRELFEHSLFLGIAMVPERQQYAHGDFLIRNLIGADAKAGTIAIGALLQQHMVVQFHLRDAQTSHDDLVSMLSGYRREARVAPCGALLFSCLGRGEFLYGRPQHDSDVFREHLGAVPLGGFFCNGEIGPVHGRTFLHGYTSSFALFRRRSG